MYTEFKDMAASRPRLSKATNPYNFTEAIPLPLFYLKYILQVLIKIMMNENIFMVKL